jgi:hypothetical protein
VTQNEPAEPAARPPVPERPGTTLQGPGTTLEGPAATGDPQVDAALATLADLAERPLNEHPAVFEHIHGALTGALGTLDSGAGGPGPGAGGLGPGAGAGGSGPVGSGPGEPGAGHPGR